MNLLKTISRHSNYQPEGGDLLRMYRESLVDQLDADAWSSHSYFRTVKKDLKDRLLDGLILDSFPKLTKVQQVHFQIFRRSVQAKIMLQSEQQLAGVKLCEETLQNAERYRLIEVAYSLSRDLEIVYARRKSSKFKRYQQKVKQYWKALAEEQEIQSLFAELAYNTLKNNPIREQEEKLALLSKKPNNDYKFRFYLYSCQNLIHRYRSDNKAIIQTCETAIQFFKTIKNPLPYVTTWSFLFQQIPVYLSHAKYGKAEIIINRCLQHPKAGSYNWHLTQLYRAVLGFYSKRPGIAIKAHQEAINAPKLFENELISSRWKIIGAYLAWLKKTGTIQSATKFRTYKFLNETTPVNTGKAHLFILELLHLWSDNKKSDYMKRAEQIPRYVQHHLKDKQSRRVRYFMKMLFALEQGDGYRLRVEKYAKRNFRELQKAPRTLNINTLDYEPVPFEWIWEMLVEGLK